MSAVQIDLDRIDISMHGVSADLAQAAVDGLGAALSQRLKGMHWTGRLPGSSELSLEATQIRPDASVAEVRALLVEQIATAIHERMAGESSA